MLLRHAPGTERGDRAGRIRALLTSHTSLLMSQVRALPYRPVPLLRHIRYWPGVACCYEYWY
eukprot:3829840-Rhodomonas_salina.2